MPLLKPTRQVGPINFLRMDQVPTTYQWTTMLTSEDRLFVHPAGRPIGYYCSPDVIPVANHDASKVTSGTFNSARIPSLDASKITTGQFGVDRIPTIQNAKLGTGLDRAKLANEGGADSSSASPTVTSTSWVLKYTLSLGTIGSGVSKILWGFTASGGTTHGGTVGLKTLDVYAAFRIGSTNWESSRGLKVAASGTSNTSHYGAGIGTASFQGVIDNPGAGSAYVDVYATIVKLSGTSSTDGQMFGADAWWTEL